MLLTCSSCIRIYTVNEQKKKKSYLARKGNKFLLRFSIFMYQYFEHYYNELIDVLLILKRVYTKCQLYGVLFVRIILKN